MALHLLYTSSNITETMQILQEVAAAQNVIVVCGTEEIAGKSFTKALRSLEILNAESVQLDARVSAVASLMGQTPLPYSSSDEDHFIMVLNIHPILKLIDMFHTHEA